jgi:hypothetical protein
MVFENLLTYDSMTFPTAESRIWKFRKDIFLLLRELLSLFFGAFGLDSRTDFTQEHHDLSFTLID